MLTQHTGVQLQIARCHKHQNKGRERFIISSIYSYWETVKQISNLIEVYWTDQQIHIDLDSALNGMAIAEATLIKNGIRNSGHLQKSSRYPKRKQSGMLSFYWDKLLHKIENMKKKEHKKLWTITFILH